MNFGIDSEAGKECVGYSLLPKLFRKHIHFMLYVHTLTTLWCAHNAQAPNLWMWSVRVRDGDRKNHQFTSPIEEDVAKWAALLHLLHRIKFKTVRNYHTFFFGFIYIYIYGFLTPSPLTTKMDSISNLHITWSTSLLLSILTAINGMGIACLRQWHCECAHSLDLHKASEVMRRTR